MFDKIVDLAESAGWEISPVAATALFCAIATDTGWFRFSSTSGGTLRAVGRLIDLGAQPDLSYRRLYERYSPARVRLTGRLLERIELACDGRLAWLAARRDDFAHTGAVPADTEDVVNECFRIVGVECAFIAHEQRDGRVKVSFRSRGDVDVATVAEGFGGGGHRQAAGALFDGPFDQGLSRLIDAMTVALPTAREKGVVLSTPGEVHEATLETFKLTVAGIEITEGEAHPLPLSMKARYVRWWPFAHPLLQLYWLPFPLLLLAGWLVMRDD